MFAVRKRNFVIRNVEQTAGSVGYRSRPARALLAPGKRNVAGKARQSARSDVSANPKIREWRQSNRRRQAAADRPDPRGFGLGVVSRSGARRTEFTRGGRADRHRLDATFIARLFAHAQPFLATCADDLGGRNRGEIVMAL